MTHMQSQSLTVRVDHPRRAYPTLRVFVDAVLVFEQDTYRQDAMREASYLRDHAEEITQSPYGPPVAIRRLLAEVPE